MLNLWYYVNGDSKVRDHYLITRKYRGSADCKRDCIETVISMLN